MLDFEFIYIQKFTIVHFYIRIYFTIVNYDPIGPSIYAMGY